MSLPMSQKAYSWEGGKNLPHKDTGLALVNMILYAKSKGIDSCIFNLSEHHYAITRGNVIKKIVNKINKNLGFSINKNSFEFYLRNKLKIPDHLKIMCGLALGYAEKYPDIKKEIHGGKKIMRENVSYYILSK